MTKTKLATVASIALLTAACAGPLCQTRGVCDKVVLSDSVTQGTVLFAFDSATLTPAGQGVLDSYVTYLKANPTKTAAISGYTDSTGPESYNLGLSKRRAASAKAYFVQNGIAAARVTTQGYGETNFVADNDTREGRAQNRRIEIDFK